MTHELAGDLRVALGQLTRRLRQQADIGDLTRSQSAVLGLIEREGPSTMSELARSLGVRPQSMGATVAALEAAGLVAGAPDERDGRKTVLSLTEHAVSLFTSGRLAREDWLYRAILEQLSEAERAELARSVELLKRLAAAA